MKVYCVSTRFRDLIVNKSTVLDDDGAISLSLVRNQIMSVVDGSNDLFLVSISEGVYTVKIKFIERNNCEETII